MSAPSSYQPVYYSGPLSPFEVGDYVLGIDTETQGLTGQPYWFAAALYRIREDWTPEMVYEKEALCDPKKAKGASFENPEQFFKDQVEHHLAGRHFNCKSPDAVDESAWVLYRQAAGEANKLGKRLHIVAQNPFPVETGVFMRCIFRNRKRRSTLGPCPFLDANTAKIVANLFHGEFPRDKHLDPRHHPGADARHAAKLLIYCCAKVRGQAARIKNLELETQKLKEEVAALKAEKAQLSQQNSQLQQQASRYGSYYRAHYRQTITYAQAASLSHYK